MTTHINFKIATPERIVFDSLIDSVTLPTQVGVITVLPNHIPLISVLVPGELEIDKSKEKIALAVSGGFIQINPNEIVILADAAEKSEEIDIQKAEEAIARAKEIREQKAVDSREFAALTAQIELELARIKVGKRVAKLAEQRGKKLKEYNKKEEK